MTCHKSLLSRQRRVSKRVETLLSCHIAVKGRGEGGDPLETDAGEMSRLICLDSSAVFGKHRCESIKNHKTPNKGCKAVETVRSSPAIAIGLSLVFVWHQKHPRHHLVWLTYCLAPMTWQKLAKKRNGKKMAVWLQYGPTFFYGAILFPNRITMHIWFDLKGEHVAISQALKAMEPAP